MKSLNSTDIAVLALAGALMAPLVAALIYKLVRRPMFGDIGWTRSQHPARTVRPARNWNFQLPQWHLPQINLPQLSRPQQRLNFEWFGRLREQMAEANRRRQQRAEVARQAAEERGQQVAVAQVPGASTAVPTQEQKTRKPLRVAALVFVAGSMLMSLGGVAIVPAVLLSIMAAAFAWYLTFRSLNTDADHLSEHQRKERIEILKSVTELKKLQRENAEKTGIDKEIADATKEHTLARLRAAIAKYNRGEFQIREGERNQNQA